MRKAGFTAARVLFSVLAASMLGAAVLAAPTAGAASSSSCTSPGNCFTLAFTSDGQPAGTAVEAHITTGFDSSGGPVKVEVLNSLGHVVAGSSVEVTVAIGSNPGSGSLSGTTTEQTIGGVASFSDLSINQPGIGYTLTASSPGITSATSAFFTVWGLLKQCSTTPCSASASSSTTTGAVTTSSASTSTTEILGDGLGGVSFTCGPSYQRTSDPFSFDLFSISGVAQPSAQFSASLEVSKSAVQASGHTGASTWQICYASTVPFTALTGTSGTAVIGGVTYNTGLLPDCSNTSPVAPCVEARNKDNAGDVIVSFLASGDPVGWM